MMLVALVPACLLMGLLATPPAHAAPPAHGAPSAHAAPTDDALMEQLVQALEKEINLDERIVNGDDAEKHAHPYIASLQIQMRHICSLRQNEMEKQVKCWDQINLKWRKDEGCSNAKFNFILYAASCSEDFELQFYFNLNSEKHSKCKITENSETQKDLLNYLLTCHEHRMHIDNRTFCQLLNLKYKDLLELCVDPPQFEPLEFNVKPNEPWTHFCGGALIKDDVVLTAAHCIDSFIYPNEYEHLRVVFGESDLEIVDNKETHRLFSEVKIHPGWAGQRSTFEDDIAIIYLNQKVDLSNPTIQAIELSDNDDAYLNNDCVIMGWGKSNPNGSVHPILQETLLENIPNEECQEIFQTHPGYHDIKSTMICVYDKGNTNEAHACQGDSGGPLVCGENLDRLAGVTSWGDPVCTALPDVYTRVSSYKLWVDMWTSDDFLDLQWIQKWDEKCLEEMKDWIYGQPHPKICSPPTMSDLRMLIGN